MRTIVQWSLIIVFLIGPGGCFFSKKKAPEPEVEVAAIPEESSPTPTEDAMPEAAEEPTVEVEEAPPKIEEAPKEEPPQIEAKTRTLPGGQDLHEVVIIENTLKLTPPKITIRLGDTVRWTNQDNRKHFLASVPGSGKTDELDIFSLMEPGKIYEHTFKEPGQYPYFCFIHNQMTGRITVER